MALQSIPSYLILQSKIGIDTFVCKLGRRISCTQKQKYQIKQETRSFSAFITGNRKLTEESLLFSSLFEDSWPTVDSRLSGGRALDNISAKFVPESTLAARSRARVISSVNQAECHTNLRSLLSRN